VTVASQVKQSLATLKSMHAGFQTFALKSQDPTAQRDFHEAMLETEKIMDDLKKRIGELEREEPQYSGN
jgi:hypothetical protein